MRKYTSLPFTECPVSDGNFGATGRLKITTVVLHTTDGGLAGTLAWFNNDASGVSSNYVIDTDGKIYAMLEEYYVPYTNGDYTSNQQSITIECVDNGQPNGPRTEATYNTLAQLVRDICVYYSLPIDRVHIKGHREVSSSHPQCPGNLDLDRVSRDAQGSQPSTDHDRLRAIKTILYGKGTIWARVAQIKTVLTQAGV